MIQRSHASKSFKFSTILTIAILGIIGVLLFSFASSYFSQSVFYADGEKYKKASEQNGMITYESRRGPIINIVPRDDTRVVVINEEEYLISTINNTEGTVFHITYTNGNWYRVEGQPHRMTTYDADGHYVTQGTVYMGNKRILSDGEELYHPSSLVQAAYPEYHEKQGTPAFYWLAILLFIYGWCGFRYEKFQYLLFILSLKWI
ncbi:hypothetical protein ACK8P5_10865 [Paenibacillus sp. EC2-1]|uniref:hypothetical protein n=1 Tax=Paenibacillus sp. EC2-1 TaxID=3388665 RepID=UPI003BEEC7F7